MVVRLVNHIDQVPAGYLEQEWVWYSAGDFVRLGKPKEDIYKVETQEVTKQILDVQAENHPLYSRLGKWLDSIVEWFQSNAWNQWFQENRKLIFWNPNWITLAWETFSIVPEGGWLLDSRVGNFYPKWSFEKDHNIPNWEFVINALPWDKNQKYLFLEALFLWFRNWQTGFSRGMTFVDTAKDIYLWSSSWKCVELSKSKWINFYDPTIWDKLYSYLLIKKLN